MRPRPQPCPPSRLAHAAAVLLAFVVIDAPAQAQSSPPAPEGSDAATRGRQHAAKGRRHYDLRQYDEAIREFERAYQLDNDPAHLYNIAQSHRLANHVPEAIASYRAYLDRLPDAPNRPDVERRIAELGAAQRPPNSLDPQPASPPAAFPPGQAAPPPPGGWPPPPGATTPAPLLGDPGTAPVYPPGPAAAPPYPYQYPYPQPALAAAAVPPGHHSHDGLFLRVQLGYGYTNVGVEKADLNVSGGSGHFALAAGAAFGGRFALFGEIGGNAVTDPDVKRGNDSVPLDGELGVVTFGIGGVLYIMPVNAYLSATAGGARVNITVEGTEFESKTGVGMTFSAGKEWWVSSNVGLGAALQLHFSAVKEDVPAMADTLTPVWLSLMFSATYN